jgi:hypothetical protein
LRNLFIEAQCNACAFWGIFLDRSGGTNDQVILPSGKAAIAVNGQSAFSIGRDIRV